MVVKERGGAIGLSFSLAVTGRYNNDDEKRGNQSINAALMSEHERPQ